MTYNQGNFKAGKATVYFKTEFLGDVQKVEVREVAAVRKPWAQYDGAVEVTFKKPRQRKARQLLGSYRPFIVVLDGWGHPNPTDSYDWSKSSTGCTVGTSRYSSFSDGYLTDFDDLLAEYFANHPEVVVLGDYRCTKGFDPHDAAASEAYLEWRRLDVARQLELAGVKPNVATEAGRNFVNYSPQRAAGVLFNEHDVPCGVSGLDLVLGDGTRVRPERFI